MKIISIFFIKTYTRELIQKHTFYEIRYFSRTVDAIFEIYKNKDPIFMEDSKIKTMDLSNVYSEFPFMESFPFQEYNIHLLSNFDDLDYELEELQDLSISFEYFENGISMSIFFIPEDIDFLFKKASKIKKLDSIRAQIDAGLRSPKIEMKTNSVLDSLEWLEEVDRSYSNIDTFDGILDDLMDINNADFTVIVADKIKKLLDGQNPNLTKNERAVISSYLNFQLHHARIVLGIVIAAKIH